MLNWFLLELLIILFINLMKISVVIFMLYCLMFCLMSEFEYCWFISFVVFFRYLMLVIICNCLVICMADNFGFGICLCFCNNCLLSVCIGIKVCGFILVVVLVIGGC